jgi:hypothetical protein
MENKSLRGVVKSVIYYRLLMWITFLWGKVGESGVILYFYRRIIE